MWEGAAVAKGGEEAQELAEGEKRRREEEGEGISGGGQRQLHLEDMREAKPINTAKMAHTRPETFPVRTVW